MSLFTLIRTDRLIFFQFYWSFLASLSKFSIFIFHFPFISPRFCRSSRYRFVSYLLSVVHISFLFSHPLSHSALSPFWLSPLSLLSLHSPFSLILPYLISSDSDSHSHSQCISPFTVPCSPISDILPFQLIICCKSIDNQFPSPPSACLWFSHSAVHPHYLHHFRPHALCFSASLSRLLIHFASHLSLFTSLFFHPPPFLHLCICMHQSIPPSVSFCILCTHLPDLLAFSHSALAIQSVPLPLPLLAPCLFLFNEPFPLVSAAAALRRRVFYFLCRISIFTTKLWIARVRTQAQAGWRVMGEWDRKVSK